MHAIIVGSKPWFSLSLRCPWERRNMSGICLGSLFSWIYSGCAMQFRLSVWSLFVSWLISLQNVRPNYSEISEVICLVSVRLLVDLPSERVAELLRDNAEVCLCTATLLTMLFHVLLCISFSYWMVAFLDIQSDVWGTVSNEGMVTHITRANFSLHFFVFLGYIARQIVLITLFVCFVGYLFGFCSFIG